MDGLLLSQYVLAHYRSKGNPAANCPTSLQVPPGRKMIRCFVDRLNSESEACSSFFPRKWLHLGDTWSRGKLDGVIRFKCRDEISQQNEGNIRTSSQFCADVKLRCTTQNSAFSCNELASCCFRFLVGAVIILVSVHCRWIDTPAGE